MKRIMIILIVGTWISPASATIINIPADYPTIQQGIDASGDGDTVLVQPGTYVENINFNGHNITLGSMFLMTGDTGYISETVIDGDSSGSVVTFENDEDGSAVISGFTIRNGSNQSGGGIYCGNSSPTMADNIIEGNLVSVFQWVNGGSGIYCSNGNPTIANNTIRENSAQIASGDVYGGGIFCYDSDASIIGNNISDNDIGGTWGTSAYGGGIGCLESDPVIAGNTISGNTVYNSEWCYGGGIALVTSNPAIDNNVITGNFSEYFGASISCTFSNPVITNNTIHANEAFAGGFYCEGESDPWVINCILWGNLNVEIYLDQATSPVFRYCDIEGGWPGEGNIDTDPFFRDPVNGDFHLKADSCGDIYNSPCIDAGDPAIFDNIHGCDWGLGELRSDMGAYGGQAIPTGINDEKEFEIPIRYRLVQNFPNPFNSSTVIRFSLPERSNVRIEIYNVLGQKVATLFEGIKQAGYHTITWHTDDNPSGVYFVNLEAGERSENIKMVLMK